MSRGRVWPGYEATRGARLGADGRQRFCRHCGAPLRPDALFGWCRICVDVREMATKTRRVRLGQEFPYLSFRTLRALTDARLAVEEVRRLTDEQFLAIRGLGPRALWEFRGWVPAPDAEICNWVGEGVA